MRTPESQPSRPSVSGAEVKPPRTLGPHADTSERSDAAVTRRERAKRIGTIVALFLVAAVVVCLHVRAYTKLSPIDEMQHFDYAEKVSRGELVRGGDFVGEAAMREESCRRIDAAFEPPPCDTPVLRPESFQEAGYATTWGQMPVYYLVTGLLGRGLAAVTGMSSILSGMRLIGALWLGVGLSLLWLVMQELNIAWTARLPVIALTATTPVVLHASATINPDAMLFPLGGALLLLTLRAAYSTRAMLALGPLALVAVLSEPTTLLAVGTAVLYFAIRSVNRSRTATRARRKARELMAASLAMFGAAAALFSTSRILSLIGGQDPGLAVPKNRSFHMEVTPTQIIGQLGSLVTPVHNSYLPPMLRTLPVEYAVRLTDWLLLGGVIGVALVGGLDRRLRPVAVATFVLMVAGGPGFAAVNALGDTFFGIPSRYGLPLLAPLMAVVAGALVTRSSRIVIGMFATAAAAASLSAIGV